MDFLRKEGLEVSERQARRWTRKRVDALPVFRFMGRIVSKRSMLRDWVGRQTIHAGAREVRPHTKRKSRAA